MKVKEFIHNLNLTKIFVLDLFVIGILIITIPTTVFLTQNRQDVRQSAQIIPTLPSSSTNDIIFPSIIITYPSNGATATKNKTLNITTSASDNIGVVRVEFYVNNILQCIDTTSIYSCPWFVPNKTKVKYIISAKAYDKAGNIKTNSITVTSK